MLLQVLFGVVQAEFRRQLVGGVEDAGLGLLLLSPLLMIAAIAVKLDSPGPVFYGQTRVGRGNRPFRIWKFRTMVVGADAMVDDLADQNQADGPLFKITDDPRITRVGTFLRKTSIDELPQLWNVLRNDMSLVGPRPGLPSEAVHPIYHNTMVGLADGGALVLGSSGNLHRYSPDTEEFTRLDLRFSGDPRRLLRLSTGAVLAFTNMDDAIELFE